MTTSPEGHRRELPRLHVVTDQSLLRSPGFASTARDLMRVAGGRMALHLRGHGLTGRELWNIASDCARVARSSGGTIIVNDRLDVAIACGADGVQLGSRSFEIGRAREQIGAGRWIGVSVHSLEEALHARDEGADFVLAGTLFDSRSHPGSPGRGLAWLEQIAAVGIPVIGIGGIRPDYVRSVVTAGAHGVAVISGVFSASEPVAAVGAYLMEFS